MRVCFFVLVVALFLVGCKTETRVKVEDGNSSLEVFRTMEK